MRWTSCFLNSVFFRFFCCYSLFSQVDSRASFILCCAWGWRFIVAHVPKVIFHFTYILHELRKARKGREDSVVLFLLLVYMYIPSTWAKPNEALKLLNKVALLWFAISNSIQVTYFHIVSVSDSLDINTDSYHSGPLYRSLRRSLMSMSKNIEPDSNYLVKQI